MTTAEAAAPAEQQTYRFEDIRLKVGDRLQLQLPSHIADDRHIVRLIGYLDQQSLLVTSPGLAGLQKPMVEGDRLIVRVFSGQGAFGFVSFVDKIIRLPFEYLHLSFPREIQGLMIRNAPRARTDFQARVETAKAQADVRVANLSATGMLLRSNTVLGGKGDELKATLELNIYGVATTLRLRGRIRTAAELPAEEGGEAHQYGIEFVGVQPEETLILQSAVHHEVARNPYSVA